MRLNRLFVILALMISILVLPGILKDVYAGGTVVVCGTSACTNSGESACTDKGSCNSGTGAQCEWCGTFCADVCPTPTPTPVPFVECSFVPNLCLCQGRGKNLFEIDCNDSDAIEDCERTRGKKPGKVLYLIEDDASKFDINCECDCSGSG